MAVANNATLQRRKEAIPLCVRKLGERPGRFCRRETRDARETRPLNGAVHAVTCLPRLGALLGLLALLGAEMVASSAMGQDPQIWPPSWLPRPTEIASPAASGSNGALSPAGIFASQDIADRRPEAPQSLAPAGPARAEGADSTRLAPAHKEGAEGRTQSDEGALSLPGEAKEGAIPLLRKATDQRTGTGTEGRAGGLAPWLTVLGALAMVVGIFLVFAWLLRRITPQAGQILPREVVEILGHTPLSSRQRLCLIRLGKKLILVAMSSDGIEPIGEVDDPAEVDRLVGLSMSHHPQSSVRIFRNVFNQYMTGTDLSDSKIVR